MPATKKTGTAKKAARKSSVPKDETKEQKFKRLAEYRLNKWLSYAVNVRNLSRYPHTAEQGGKIVEAVKEAAEMIERAFSESPQAEKKTFAL